MNQALQTIERRVNELGVAEPIVARHSAADQILVQLPGVTDVNRAKEIIRSTALLELKLVEQGPFPDENAARAGLRQQPAARHAGPARTIEGGAPASRPAPVYYVVRRVPVVTGRDLRNARPTLDENNRPAVSFSLNQEGARKFGAFTAGEHRPPAGHRARQPRAARRRRIESRIDDEGRITGNFTAAGSAGPVADAALRRAAGVADLPRRAHRRPVARRRLDPRRRDRGGRRPAAGDAVHARSTTSSPASTRSSRSSVNLIILLGLMAYLGRDHDAAGHRRLHSDDRHGRRLERADLRAHQGRTGDAPRASSRRWRPASTACC